MRSGPTPALLAVFVLAVGFIVVGFALQLGGGDTEVAELLIALGAIGSLAVGIWTRGGRSR